MNLKIYFYYILIMSIILNLRDGNLIIPKKYYETYLNIDWFLSGLINFSESNDEHNTYTL
tara:strand:- start:173 stop:352 length:180 start_codon:yes stop_codon:yes gene_type:complete